MNKFFAVLFFFCSGVYAGSETWIYPGGDAGGQRYSTLTGISKENVAGLEKVWEFRYSETEGETYRYALQASPLFLPKEAGGHLVSCSPFGRIFALDPENGTERWSFDSKLDESKVKNLFKCRGITYWVDPIASENSLCKHRLLMAVIDRRIVAIDARTGQSCENFGDNGVVSLYESDGSSTREPTVFSTSPPVVAGDNVIVGSQIEDFNHAFMPTGAVKAIDVRTGEHKWTFLTIPDTAVEGAWPKSPRENSGAANVWAPLSVDEERNLVFLPVGAPSPDYYGVFRPGDNKYANSLVALNANTGAVEWHFQFVHHDLWDYDVPSQPILTDVLRDGKSIPAVVQTTKQGMIFVFNRVTGEPLFDIEERAVPKSLIEGEQTSPTQPFPVVPLPLVKHDLTADDAWGFTFWDRGKCKEELENLRNEGIYTPFGTEPTIYNPSALGGMNWGGASVSVEDQLLVVNLSNTAMFAQLLPIAEADSQGHWNPALTQVNAMKGTPYAVVMGAIVSPLGIPCSPPPWGKLAAIDLVTGDIKWESTLGSVHEMGPIPAPFEVELGTPNLGGPLLTKTGLVFIGGTMDRRIRAFNSKTGEKLWTGKLPFDGSSSPMTYSYEGRQYVVIAAGGQPAFGRPTGDVLVAFALPQ